MCEITKEQFDFVEEARDAFESYPAMETYRNEEETLLAFRYGLNRDCILVYQIDGTIGRFTQMLKPSKVSIYEG